jgi:hypothetical protein
MRARDPYRFERGARRQHVHATQRLNRRNGRLRAVKNRLHSCERRKRHENKEMIAETMDEGELARVNKKYERKKVA